MFPLWAGNMLPAKVQSAGKFVLEVFLAGYFASHVQTVSSVQI